MNNPTPQITNTKFIELIKTYWAWRRLWIATTVVFGGLGLVYVLFLKNDMWTASQGLIVRDEANGAVMRLGRFQSQTEMKAAQETILEMARNTQVLREALLEVGPAKSLLSFSKISESWPSQREVSELAEDSIGVRAPQGAEFGTTEVIYLDIKQHTRDRSLDLNKAVCKALDNRLRQVRVARADGVIDELVRASNMATEDLKKASEQLQLVEREAGADLADLRGLSEANGSGSAARSQLENVKTEIRQAETLHSTLQSDLALLKETQADPDRILSAPASILSAHPGLRKLREGLADAQLATSQLRGRFTGTHPLVFVATSAESEIKQQLQHELSQASTNSEREVAVSQARIDKLKRQQQQLEERLERLARIRTEHEQLNQEVRSRTRILQDAERQLADTRAARDAALTTSLLTRIDDPVLGERPVGPGRTTILAAMTIAGLCFGLGIVFLLTPLDGSTPDSGRWNEQLGRRLSDRFPWLADQGPGGAPRRRRNDQERRQSTDAPPRTASGSPRGRRQSDQAIAGMPVTTAPEIKEEDPSVASRLDDMLRSELAAMAPIPVERISVERNVALEPAAAAHANAQAPESASQVASRQAEIAPQAEADNKPNDGQLPASQLGDEQLADAKLISEKRTPSISGLGTPSSNPVERIDSVSDALASAIAEVEPVAANVAPVVPPVSSPRTVKPIAATPQTIARSADKDNAREATKESPEKAVPARVNMQSAPRTKEPIRPRLRVRDVPRAKPQPAERPASERPVSEQPVSDRPVSDRPVSDRPRSDRPVSDRPRSDRPVSDRMASGPNTRVEPSSDRPSSQRPTISRPPASPSSSAKPPAVPPSPAPERATRPMAPGPGKSVSQSSQSAAARPSGQPNAKPITQSAEPPAVIQAPPSQPKPAQAKIQPRKVEERSAQQPPAEVRKPSAKEKAEGANPAATGNPAKPGRNLFKPDQSLDADTQAKSARPIGFNQPVEPPPAKPLPLANSFETPAEGGLAGIGLPTQKLPDSFQFRNNPQ